MKRNGWAHVFATKVRLTGAVWPEAPAPTYDPPNVTTLKRPDNALTDDQLRPGMWIEVHSGVESIPPVRLWLVLWVTSELAYMVTEEAAGELGTEELRQRLRRAKVGLLEAPVQRRHLTDLGIKTRADSSWATSYYAILPTNPPPNPLEG